MKDFQGCDFRNGDLSLDFGDERKMLSKDALSKVKDKSKLKDEFEKVGKKIETGVFYHVDANGQPFVVIGEDSIG